MPQPVIVGIGEVLWDVFPDGEHFGGAPANVAIHAAALGAESYMISAVGPDARGSAALARLDAAGVNRTAVAQLLGHPTGVVNVSVDAKGQPSFDIAADVAWDYLPWSRAVEEVAERADAICFGTLAQRASVSRATIKRAVRTTFPRMWRLFDVNLRQDYYDETIITSSLEMANAVKLNDEELPVVARLCRLSATGAVDQLRMLCDWFGLRLAALTRGAAGSLLVTPSEVCESAALATGVRDTVGAGDAFTAALLVGLLERRSLAEVSQRANAVAAYVCSQPGATPPIPATLRW
ncbi:MAG TPA: carbohydrate kinase [Gemmatimonadaceae bacterium]|jgi:fructokinase|nr:carbohydrate kinase [Gemmatimonadaceae bacterium]